MNNKGFAITGILYTVLIMFLVFISMMLFNLQNRKTILDELKSDTVNAVESDNNYEYLLTEINKLKSQIGTSDISSFSDGTITGNISDLNEMDKIEVNSTDIGVNDKYANYIKELHDSLKTKDRFVGIVTHGTSYAPIIGIKYDENQAIYIKFSINWDTVVIYSFRGDTDSMYIRTSFTGESTKYSKS